MNFPVVKPINSADIVTNPVAGATSSKLTGFDSALRHMGVKEEIISIICNDLQAELSVNNVKEIPSDSLELLSGLQQLDTFTTFKSSTGGNMITGYMDALESMNITEDAASKVCSFLLEKVTNKPTITVPRTFPSCLNYLLWRRNEQIETMLIVSKAQNASPAAIQQVLVIFNKYGEILVTPDAPHLIFLRCANRDVLYLAVWKVICEMTDTHNNTPLLEDRYSIMYNMHNMDSDDQNHTQQCQQCQQWQSISYPDFWSLPSHDGFCGYPAVLNPIEVVTSCIVSSTHS